MLELKSRLQSVTDKGRWAARRASFVAKLKATKAVWLPPASGATSKKTAAAAKKTTKRATKTTTSAAKRSPAGTKKAKSPASSKTA